MISKPAPSRPLASHDEQSTTRKLRGVSRNDRERAISRVELSAHSFCHAALKNEVYDAPSPDVITDTPEMTRDGAV